MRFQFQARFLRSQHKLVPGSHYVVVLHGLRAEEDPGQGVIIGRGNGVELVIVASGTADRQAHERARRRVDLLVDDIHLHLDRVVFGQHLGAEREEAGGGPVFELRGVVGSGKKISGQLFLHELIVRLVLIERANHVIAIPPCVPVHQVLVEPVRIGITGYIEPVPRPSLSIMRRGQQAVYDFCERIETGVGQERVHFLRCRGQPGQIECGAADQGALIGRGRRLQAFQFERAQDEGVDRRLNPRDILYGRRFRRHRRHKSPVSRRWPFGAACGRGAPGSTHFDPSFDKRNIAVLQLAGGRHFQAARLHHGIHQQALGGLARNHSRAAGTALDQVLAAVNPQAAHPGGCGVAGLALAREQGPYIGFEECGSVFLGIGKGRHRNHAGEGKSCRGAGVPHKIGRFYHCGNGQVWDLARCTRLPK